MFFKNLLFFVLLSCWGNAYAQSGDICSAILTITRDAPAQFRNIKGKVIEANANATMWASGIKVPGSIGSRFVASMGLFYECAFFQTKNKDEIGPVYEKYKDILNSCLLHEGYTLSMQPNFYPGIGEYKKLVFMPEVKNNVKMDTPPPHITLEATYNKDAKQYTIVLFIFEH